MTGKYPNSLSPYCDDTSFFLGVSQKLLLVTVPKKWHKFLFSAAYFPSYWHESFGKNIDICHFKIYWYMPYEISIIKIAKLTLYLHI